MSESKTVLSRDKSGKLTLASAGLSASVLGYGSPVLAQTTTPLDNVTSMITSLGGIAGTITVVVVGAMAVRMAIKLVNRVGVKG